MNDVRIALVNPPLGSIIQPYVALAALQGHLRARGFEQVRLWDVSQRIVCRLLRGVRLAEATEALDARVARFEGRAVLDAREAEHYAVAVSGRAAGRIAGPVIERCVADLRDPVRFYHQPAYERAVRGVTLALKALSALHHPQRLDWTTYQASVEEEIDGAERVREFLTRPEQCLFHRELEAGIVDDIVADGPALVGISATFYGQFLPALLIARLVKERLPRAHVVLGGAFVSERIGEIGTSPWLFDWIDSVAVHEGETAIETLARALAGAASLEAVPNLYRRRDGGVVPPATVHTESLESLPAPDYQGYDIERYLCPEWDLIYDPTRGCYWNQCTFCSVSLSARRTASRARPANRIVDHIEALCEAHRSDVITFGVDAIPVPLMRSVCEELLRRGLDVGWSSEFILDKRLDAPTIELFAAAGCLLLLFGVESASPRIVKAMRKGTSIERTERILRDCAGHGIAVLVHLMAGFPGETREELEETLAFVERNRESIDIYEISPFTLVDNVPLMDTAAQAGITAIGPLERRFQSWNARRYEAAQGLDAAEVQALLPALRERLDEALALERRASLYLLRQDTSHLHLYLKRLRARPRRLHATAPVEPGALCEAVRSPFDLVDLYATVGALRTERERAALRLSHDPDPDRGSPAPAEALFLRSRPFLGLLTPEEGRVSRARELADLTGAIPWQR